MNIGMKILDIRASIMTQACKEGSKTAKSATMSFFKYANENKLPTQALIACYDNANKMKGYSSRQLSSDIISLASDDKSLRTELKRFEHMVKENYPKTLGDRISLLSNGAVVPNKVKPQSFFVKMFASLNKFFRKIEE